MDCFMRRLLRGFVAAGGAEAAGRFSSESENRAISSVSWRRKAKFCHEADEPVPAAPDSPGEVMCNRRMIAHAAANPAHARGLGHSHSCHQAGWGCAAAIIRSFQRPGISRKGISCNRFSKSEFI